MILYCKCITATYTKNTQRGQAVPHQALTAFHIMLNDTFLMKRPLPAALSFIIDSVRLSVVQSPPAEQVGILVRQKSIPFVRHTVTDGCKA